MNDLEMFCRQIRTRSDDNSRALQLLHTEHISSQVISILRQELDSLIRVIYLLSISDMEYREELITASVNGLKWTEKGKKRRITDREMVDLANKLHGWTESVYRFGCAFIHLSNFHDYQERDPMEMISTEEKDALLKHMRYYHGGPLKSHPSFSDLFPYLPNVFNKIKSNLESYIKQLEAGKSIED